MKLKNSILKFKDDQIQDVFSITKILNSNQYFNENNLYKFNNEFKYNLTKEQLYEIENREIYEFNKYSCLYGLYIEKLFMFYYYKNKNMIKEFIDFYKNKLEAIIFIDKKYINEFKIYLKTKVNSVKDLQKICYVYGNSYYTDGWDFNIKNVKVV